MAKFDLKFIDAEDDCTIETRVDNGAIKIVITQPSYSMSIINLDKSTAIKFAKTLRTEINKIKE
jgi:hypothetical protein